MDQKVEKSVKKWFNFELQSDPEHAPEYEEIAQNHQVGSYPNPVDIKDQLIEFLKLDRK